MAKEINDSFVSDYVLDAENPVSDPAIAREVDQTVHEHDHLDLASMVGTDKVEENETKDPAGE